MPAAAVANGLACSAYFIRSAYLSAGWTSTTASAARASVGRIDSVIKDMRTPPWGLGTVRGRGGGPRGRRESGRLDRGEADHRPGVGGRVHPGRDGDVVNETFFRAVLACDLPQFVDRLAG